MEFPTFNCLTAEAPADPVAAGCTRSVTEYAELASPDLVRRPGRRRPARSAAGSRPSCGPTAARRTPTGRAYDAADHRRPPARRPGADGGPPTACCELGPDARTVDEPTAASSAPAPEPRHRRPVAAPERRGPRRATPSSVRSGAPSPKPHQGHRSAPSTSVSSPARASPSRDHGQLELTDRGVQPGGRPQEVPRPGVGLAGQQRGQPALELAGIAAARDRADVVEVVDEALGAGGGDDAVREPGRELRAPWGHRAGGRPAGARRGRRSESQQVADAGREQAGQSRRPGRAAGPAGSGRDGAGAGAQQRDHGGRPAAAEVQERRRVRAALPVGLHDDGDRPAGEAVGGPGVEDGGQPRPARGHRRAQAGHQRRPRHGPPGPPARGRRRSG